MKIVTAFSSVAIISILFVGCAQVEIQKSIESYELASQKIKLGDNKKKVLSILQPTQKNLELKYRKKSEKYMKSNHLFEIYYIRSAWQQDGLTTDDEFTPYVFKDGVLIAIGWAYLGGAKTQGQSSSTTFVSTPIPTNTVSTYTPPAYKPYTPSYTPYTNMNSALIN